MEDYIRKVNYHETDKMGITHHSNYIKYLEEARIHFLDQLGYGYARLERDGIVSPVVGVDCQYKHATTFDDVLRVSVRVLDFSGVKLIFAYTITEEKSGQVVLTGRTQHCFTNAQGRPIILKKQFPELDELLKKLIQEETL